MPQIIDKSADNNASQQQPLSAQLGSGESVQQPVASALAGQSNITTFDTAFGFRSFNSRADMMVGLLTEARKKNAGLEAFHFGTWPVIDASLGSLAWFAGEYKGALLVGAVLFEAGQSFHVVVNGNKETYYTTNSLFKPELTDQLVQYIASQPQVAAKYQGNIHFIAVNTVPDIVNLEMNEQWAMRQLGQLMLSIFGRAPGFLGDMKLGANDRFIASIAGSGMINYVQDANGHAHRADFQLELTHMPVNSNQQATPTLTGAGQAQGYPRLSAAGYVNFRYIGLRPAVAGVAEQNLRQLQPEVIATVMDSQTDGSSMAPIQRQLVALGSFVALAADGGWRDLAIRSFDREQRKLSALAAHMNWGSAQVGELNKLDGSVEAVAGFIDNFCLQTAAVVMYHRAGNGIGGLTALLAEIALGHNPAIAQLLELLDGMFPNVRGDGVNFRQYFVRQLQAANPQHAAEINFRDIIAAAVPTVAGVYQGTATIHSFQEADLVRAANFFGDKSSEMRDFVYAQSYDNRTMSEQDQRIYLLKLFSTMFAGGKPRATGEALEMAINPIFGKALLDAIRSSSRLEVAGVSAFNAANNAMFVGGESFAVAAAGQGSALSDFSLGGVTGGTFTY